MNLLRPFLVLLLLFAPFCIRAQDNSLLDLSHWRRFDVGDKRLAPAWSGQSGIVVATDGDTYFAVWSDSRNSDPYPAPPAAELFGTRIDGSGNLRNPSGIDLGIQIDGGLALLWNGTGYAVFAHTPSAWVAGELSRDGEWIRAPAPIFETDQDYLGYIRIVHVDDGYLVASWTEGTVASTYQVAIRKLSNDFSTVLPEYQVASRAGAWVAWMEMAHHGDDTLLVWADGSGRTLDLLHIHNDGTLATADITESEPVSVFFRIAAVSTDDGYLVAWCDSARVEIARVDSAGLLPGRTALPIGTAGSQLAWNGSSAVIAVDGIVGTSPYDTDIFAAQLDSAGSLLTPLVPITTSYGGQRVSAVASTSSSSIVVWDDSRSGANVFAAVEGPSLRPLPREFPVANSVHGQLYPKLAHNGSVNAVVWTEGADQFSMGVLGQVVDENGRPTSAPFYTGRGVSAGVGSATDGFLVLTTNSVGMGATRISNSGVTLDQSPIVMSPCDSARVASNGEDLLVVCGKAQAFHWAEATTSASFTIDNISLTEAAWTGDRFAVAATKTYPDTICRPHCTMPGFGIVVQAMDSNANPLGDAVRLPGGGAAADSSIAFSPAGLVVAYSLYSSPQYQGDFQVVDIDPRTYAVRRSLMVIQGGYCGEDCTAVGDVRIVPTGDDWFLTWSWSRQDSYYRTIAKGRSAAVIANDFTLHEVNIDSTASRWLSSDLDVWRDRVVIAASYRDETEVPRSHFWMQPRVRPRPISR